MTKIEAMKTVREAVESFKDCERHNRYKDKQWYGALEWLMVIAAIVQLLKLLYECNKTDAEIRTMLKNPTRLQRVLVAWAFNREFGVQRVTWHNFREFRMDILKHAAEQVSNIESLVEAFQEEGEE